jgi:branched-chain amino acid transport system ATP-binding protein
MDQQEDQAMSQELLLQARGLNKQFGAVVAASDLNISIRPGERVSLIGSNGAGKTTFVNMITGYVKPDSGDITFSGQAIQSFTPRQIMRLGVARSFQIPQLYPSLSVLDNMLVALACHDDRLSL